MDRDPIDFTLKAQRVMFLMAGISFLGLSSILTFLNPYQNSNNLWIFLAVLFVFLGCFISLISFWWVFSLQKKILTVLELQKLIYQGFMLALALIAILILYITNNFNSLNLLGVLVCYFLYRFWIR